MKLIADPIYIPDNSDWQTIEDAKARANWHEVKSREELMKNTNLDGKCGSCKNFVLSEKRNSMGRCTLKGQYDCRGRCTRGCKHYERRNDES